MVAESDHPSVEERMSRGKAARADTPLASHGEWTPGAARTDPIDLLAQQAAARVPELVPIRHGRMAVSPFTYYRGAALPMAADLATTPSSGLVVQLCGDAHLSNFGMFGSPERHLMFDVNDFDETAAGPWEWDVKRLTASLEVAGREHQFPVHRRRAIVQRSVRAYREAMHRFARMAMLDVWYAHLDTGELLPRFRSLLDPEKTPSVWHAISKARAHDSLRSFAKLCHPVDGKLRISPDPPLIVPLRDYVADLDPHVVSHALDEIFQSYLDTLETDRRLLLEHYRVVDAARKVVGVGSVGTEAWIALLVERVRAQPLFLQIKEADASVLERFTGTSPFPNHGQRVVAGQRLVQAASDIFLGWVRFASRHGERDYYLRQLHDWKGSADVAGMTAAGMELWGEMCGWTLARAHARSGDRIAIASYLGKSDAFDRAIADFSAAYADQNERDFATLQDALASGRLIAETGL